MVDSRNNHIRLRIHQPGQPDVDAVGRGAIETAEAIVGRTDPVWPRKRERVARTTAVTVGSDHKGFGDTNDSEGWGGRGQLQLG